MTWILVIYIYAGALANGDSVTLQKIDSFSTKEMCVEAGKEAQILVQGSTKVYRFICLKR
jgi:hypothetical protein